MDKKFEENTNEFIDEVSKIFKTKKRTKEILIKFFNNEINVKNNNSDYQYYVKIKQKIKEFDKLFKQYPHHIKVIKQKAKSIK
jgi:hypothetical protein